MWLVSSFLDAVVLRSINLRPLNCTVKKRLAIFPSPDWISQTKLSLAGIIYIHGGDGKIGNLFLQCGPILGIKKCQSHNRRNLKKVPGSNPSYPTHRLNMEVDLQSLFGLLVTWCAHLTLIGWDLASTLPIPPHWGLYWSVKIDDISL
jgi:hypothetical protein